MRSGSNTLNGIRATPALHPCTNLTTALYCIAFGATGFGSLAEVQTDLSARPIASLGASLIATIIAAGLFGSAAPATAQDGYGNIFGISIAAALQSPRCAAQPPLVGRPSRRQDEQEEGGEEKRATGCGFRHRLTRGSARHCL